MLEDYKVYNQRLRFNIQIENLLLKLDIYLD